MKAVIYKQYGGPEVLQLVNQTIPVPEDDQILVNVKYTTVTTTECYFRAGKPYIVRLFTGLFKPKNQMLGEEIAGEVVEVGKNSTGFKKGDHVFGTMGPKFGGNAEYVSIGKEGVLDYLPENTSLEDAVACVDGFLTAMPFLRDTGKIKKGQKVLINGAAGMIGAAAVQIAKHFGAEVTGVGSSSSSEIIKGLGADHVIDYTQEDFTKSDKTYDIIFDTVGKTSFGKCKKVMNRNGIFLSAAVSVAALFSFLSFSGKKIKTAATGLRKPEEKRKDLALLKEWLESGTYKALIDQTLPIDDIVKAHQLVDKGHKKGSMVIKV